MSRKRFGPWKRISVVRVRNHQLMFPHLSAGGMTTAPLAMGLAVHRHSGTFEVRSNGEDQQVRVQVAGSTEKILVSPPFLQTRRISLIGSEEEADLEFWAIENHADRNRCLQLLKRVHYLPMPRRGIFLACRFRKTDQQQAAFRNAPRGTRQREWTRPGVVIACAVVDTLMHGQPLGRIGIAETLGISSALGQWTRAEAVSNLRVAWLSRIAVAPPFQHLGIGTQLALMVRRMTRQMRIPKTDFLEVIRSFPINDGKQRDNRKDFLERAGFLKVRRPMRSKQCQFPVPNSRRSLLQKAIKFYYYADLRHDD